MNAFSCAEDSYNDRRFLYIFPRPNGSTYNAVNYHAINSGLNSFLTLFDVWNCGGGLHKSSEDDNHQEVWFEVDEEFYQLTKNSETFRRAIEKLGVEIVFEYPFRRREQEEWVKDWRELADVVYKARALVLNDCEDDDDDYEGEVWD